MSGHYKTSTEYIQWKLYCIFSDHTLLHITCFDVLIKGVAQLISCKHYIFILSRNFSSSYLGEFGTIIVEFPSTLIQSDNKSALYPNVCVICEDSRWDTRKEDFRLCFSKNIAIPPTWCLNNRLKIEIELIENPNETALIPVINSASKLSHLF